MSSSSLFFIAGLPRSGTTWVQYLLDAHPNLACFGEANIFGELIPRLEKALGSYNKFCGDVENGKLFPVNGLSEEAYQQVVRVAVLHAFADNVDLNDPNVSAFGEKTPDNLIYLPRIVDLFPDAKVIHVVRDGRDTAVSAWYRFLPKLEKKHETRLDFIRYFAKEWATRIEGARAIGAKHPGRHYELLYENLHAEPETSLAHVFEFLGVSDNDDITSSCLEKARFDILSDGRDRGIEQTEHHFRKGVVGDWRERLSGAEKDAFWDIAKSTLKSTGYE